MNVGLQQCAKSIPESPNGDSSGGLFVSTSLATWTTANPDQFARDFQIDDAVYRRLDPEYYAWLRSRMHMARLAAAAGRLPQESFDQLRRRFNAVHDWGVGHFGESVLAEAFHHLRACDYQPPMTEPETPTRRSGTRGAERDRPPVQAIALVDTISGPAVALGWKRERLYSTGTLFSQDRGLVSFLKPDDRIGVVTLQSIELIGPPPQEVRQRFYNPNVAQPWIHRTSSGAE